MNAWSRAVSLLAVVACFDGGDDQTGGADILCHGEIGTDCVLHSLAVDNGDGTVVTRKYCKYTPASAAALHPSGAPVVFVFHGGGGDGPDFFSGSEWRTKADQEGLILVFPSALLYCYCKASSGDEDDDEGSCSKTCDDDPEHPTLCKKTSWDQGTLAPHDETDAGRPLCSDQDRKKLEMDSDYADVQTSIADDFRFVEAVITEIGQDTTCAKVGGPLYATGFSNGSSFTQRLMLHETDSFAAFAAHAGSLKVRDEDPTSLFKATRLFVSVGAADTKTGAISDPSAPIDMDLVNTDTSFKERYVLPPLEIMELEDSPTYSEANWTCLSNTDGIERDHKVHTWTYDKPLGATAGTLVINVLEGVEHEYPDCMPEHLWDFFQAP